MSVLTSEGVCPSLKVGDVVGNDKEGTWSFIYDLCIPFPKSYSDINDCR